MATTVIKLQDSHIFSRASSRPRSSACRRTCRLSRRRPDKRSTSNGVGRTQQLPQLRNQQPAAPCERHGVDVLQHGPVGHELKFGFQYRHPSPSPNRPGRATRLGSDTSSAGPHCGKNLDRATRRSRAEPPRASDELHRAVGDTITMDWLTVRPRFDYQQETFSYAGESRVPDPCRRQLSGTRLPITYRNWNPLSVSRTRSARRRSLS